MTRTGEPSPLRREVSTRALLMVGAVAVTLAAAGLWVLVAFNDYAVPFENPPWYAVAALIAAFLAGETLPIRFELSRGPLLVSLSELPLVIGVVLLPPWLVGGCYVASGLVAFTWQRSGWRSGMMNILLIAMESGIAVLIVASLAGPIRDSPAVTHSAGDLLAMVQPRFGPAALGVMVGALVSAIGVALARRLIGLPESLPVLIGRSMLTAGLVVGLGLAGVTVWQAIPGGPILCLVLAVACAVLYRSYHRFLEQHASLADIYSFGAQLARVGGDLRSWHDLVSGVRDQVQARVAVLYLLDRPAGAVSLGVGPDGPVEVPIPHDDDPLLARARAEGFATATAGPALDPATRTALEERGAHTVMVAELRAGDRNRGFIEVHDPRSKWRRFSSDHQQRLQTLAGHLATALDNRRLLERLRHAAYHDSVTGLSNRSGVVQRGTELIDVGDFGGVLLIQLNILDDVAGALGREHGEQLLGTVARRLGRAVGDSGLVGRIDADLFAVLLGPRDEDSALQRGRELLAAACEPVTLDTVEIEPEAVGGIALVNPEDESPVAPTTMLQHAQLALAAAQATDDELAIYRPALGATYQRRFQLASQFRHAVDSGRVLVYYQPKLGLLERDLIGVESLVRWMHPEYGFVSPAEFVAVIENTSSINVLFWHMLDKTLGQIHDWLERGIRIGASVNLSARNLLVPHFADRVVEALESHAVPPEMLTLEITESSVMDQPERSLPILSEVHGTGIRLSIDDFGTGYSSLAYLRKLPIDELKIDRSFVQGMMTDLGDLAIVRAIIDLGHSLGFSVVAEGVEDEAARDALRSMRCDVMQGFLLARPLPLDRFENWVTSRMEPTQREADGRPRPLRLRV